MVDSLPHILSVFLADDDADDRFLFEEALMEIRKDVKLISVNNGEQLMFELDRNDLVSPYLIFLDLNMPLKNGIECLDEIKSNSYLKNIPVVIFSTSSQKETINQVYVKGANYYMCKPDNFQKLKMLLGKIFSLNQTTLNERPNRDNFIINV